MLQPKRRESLDQKNTPSGKKGLSKTAYIALGVMLGIAYIAVGAVLGITAMKFLPSFLKSDPPVSEVKITTPPAKKPAPAAKKPIPKPPAKKAPQAAKAAPKPAAEKTPAAKPPAPPPPAAAAPTPAAKAPPPVVEEKADAPPPAKEPPAEEKKPARFLPTSWNRGASTGEEKLEATIKIPLSVRWPRGIIVEGYSITSVDRKSGDIISIDPKSTRPRREVKFPNKASAGISRDGTGLWSLDSSRKKICLHDPETFAIKAEFVYPGAYPLSIHADGTHIWTADASAQRVYKQIFRNGMLEMSKVYSIEEQEPIALFKRGSDLWILDGKSSKLGRYRISEESLTRTGVAKIKELVPEESDIRSFTVEGKYMWILVEGEISDLYRIDIGRVAFSSNF